jgi:hypothetical protein
MRTFWGSFFIGTVIVIKQIHALSVAQAKAVGDRFAVAASAVTGDIYQLIEIHVTYPSDHVLDEARVSDLEFLSRR